MAKLLAEFDTAHCGVIHDAQLDAFGQCLATASADGHVRLWDVRKPEAPAFLADLGGHEGAVHMVAWAPPVLGVLLASGSSDGSAAVWGRCASSASRWQRLRHFALESHGPLLALAWAPAEHGAALACASDDGTVTVASHAGTVRSGDATVEHRWETSCSFQAHEGRALAVSWATPPVIADKPTGMKGARLATAGDDGVRVWCWSEALASWEPEAVEESPGAAAGAAGAAAERPAGARDVAWMPWDGVEEILASAAGQAVGFWARDAASGRWQLRQSVALDAEVHKVSWSDVGGMLLVSFGLSPQRSALLKQRVDGEWDVMEVAAEQ